MARPMPQTDRGEVLWVTPEFGPPVALRFVESASALLVVPTGSGGGWLAPVLEQGEVRIRLPSGASELRNVRLVTEPGELRDIVTLLAAKYGEDLTRNYFRDVTRALELSPGGGSGRGESHDDVVRQEFEAVAAVYDAQIERSYIHRILKGRSLARLHALFDGHDPLLELGSGTGRETIPLLQAGHRILAVDISPRMIDQLRQRAQAVGVGDRLRTQLGSLENLEEALADVASGSLHGAYSTFGAVNLEPSLTSLPAALGRVLGPGDRFFAGVLQRNAIVPSLYSFVLGRPRVAVGQFGNVLRPGASHVTLKVYPTDVANFSRLMRSHFDLEQWESASLLCPPDDLPRLWRFLGDPGLRRIVRIDERASGWPRLRRWSQWIFLTFRRR
ncbi:MAG: class I SAM-dependent methyltransferase [Thermoplasmata archaeon]|nr:class I SAM-dependent methyltransferase [Thermoplasmata archaeon]